MSQKYLILIAVTGFIITFDQVTKLYIHTQFDLGESYTIIKNFFELTYVRNEGAAFGMFREAHVTFRTVFLLSVPPLAMVLIIFMLRGVSKIDRWQILSLSGIFGGALGNYIDRLRFGYVVDFLDFHWSRAYTFPAFNVADSAIVVGVFILFIIMSADIKEQEKEKAKAKEKEEGKVEVGVGAEMRVGTKESKKVTVTEAQQ